MTDLEITRLCAEAIGVEMKVRKVIRRTLVGGSVTEHTEKYAETLVDVCDYDPLTNDAQAMELVRKFNLFIEAPDTPVSRMWHAFCWLDPAHEKNVYSASESLNHAICVCVANMQQAKASAQLSRPPKQ